MTKLYAPTPDGYCGDEDNGQTSAWYVFSALGFYPVTPGVDQYVIGSPLFKKAILTLQNGNKFTISAPNNSRKNLYINSATLDGERWGNSYIEFDRIQNGGFLEFNMSHIPNKSWASKPDNVPFSMSNSMSK